MNATTLTATVTKSMGLWYEVHASDGQMYNCRIKGKFRIEGKKITNPVAVGDEVRIMDDTGNPGYKVIYEILPRDNYMIRKSPKKMGHSHIIAANIDQALLLATVAQPRTSAGFIDRFLVTAEAFRIPAIVVFNKSDLLDQESMDRLQAITEDYEAIGYKSFIISALDPKDMALFERILEGKTTLLAGHSGVGKSTLINELIPEVNQKTNEVSSFANKGVHTTTFAERFSINPSSHIIDTPGIKELGLAEVEQHELSHYFPELRDLLGTCKFNNCSHTHEPGCAMVEAYESGKISQARYESYIGMLLEEDNRR